MQSEINDLKNENLKSDRQIRQMKTFTSKRDEDHKKMKDEHDELNQKLNDLNAEIVNKAWKLDQE